MTTEEGYNDFLNKLVTLYDRGEATNITDWVFENVTGLQRYERRIHKDYEIKYVEEKLLATHLQALLQHMPVQYVLHEAWFYKMKFFVNEHVLIPRPETEELVSWVVRDIRGGLADYRFNECRLLDIGTGSGCIAISAKTEIENVGVTAIDVNDEVLLIAKRNAQALQAEVDFLKINFLDEGAWGILGKYDIVVSNPPYIPEMEKEKLSKHVAAFEPGIALFVRDDDPFIFYEKIARFGQRHLKEGGRIFVEIHEGYSVETTKIFESCNYITEARDDMYGKKRMIQARLVR
ncbi:MAG: peptide chain release factor N(5)-glutamine methyltransferase [Ginsengibacter sp.]